MTPRRNAPAHDPVCADICRGGHATIGEVERAEDWCAMTVLEAIGGEARLRDLVETFYDLVEQLPEGSNLRRLHGRGHGIAHARTEQFNFLSGFMGGRQYYQEKHGHMDVKLMHAHVPIRQADAENWLHCMKTALDAEGHTGPQIDKLHAVFTRVATVLINEVPDWEDDMQPKDQL